MNIHPRLVVDQGCWISDDRIYAFISWATNSIGEIGYHGAQPVSRNSRMLVREEGVCSFWIRNPDGGAQQLRFGDVDWTPGSLCVQATSDTERLALTITAAGSRLIVAASPTSSCDRAFVVRFNTKSRFSDVHGERTWSSGILTDSRVAFTSRDRILLDDWMKRAGPYAGDFLIPEPLRRTIFKRSCRSGSAKAADLLPSYMHSDMPIYDAETTILLGGGGYEAERHDADIDFVRAGGDRGSALQPFVVECGGPDANADRPGDPGASAFAVQARHRQLLESAPKMHMPGFPRVEEFVATVPALLESCEVRALGIPRATPGRYYWIWAWDAMVTGLSSLRWHESTVAESTARFVNTHRDAGGLIPMRWTRALEPLDAQPRGSLEALLASLSYEISRERKDTRVLEEVYSAMKDHLITVSAACNEQGLFANIGFYPDLPLEFGRSLTSAVAMEIGNFYVFCRTCENTATVFSDEETRHLAARMAALIEQSFIDQFWDCEKGFLIDSIDVTSGQRNASYPLFTLLFLHSSLGWPLIRSRLADCAGFLGRHHCSTLGMRLLPAWDKNVRSETASSSWYPHWDLYALKILRRAGHADEIVSWLADMHTVLEKLGYAPEFLMMDGLRTDDGASWLRHGAASNLNCVTGWYQALLEGIFGLERDPGGLTVVPLALPLGTISLSGMRCMGTVWNVTVNNAGSGRCSLRVDGRELRGSMKVPFRYYDGGVHTLDISYDSSSPVREFLELVNAELVATECTDRGMSAAIRALGSVEVVFIAPAPARCFLDGVEVHNVEALSNGTYAARLWISGEHTVGI